MLLKFTYYSQEQELWSEYYAIYIKVCMKKLLLVVDNFRKTVLFECIYEWYRSIYTTNVYQMMTVWLLEYIDRLLQFSINA